MSDKGDIIVYQADDDETKIEVYLEGETVWLSQAEMARLFQKTVPSINIHIRNIYREGELQREATVKESQIVQQEGKRKVTRTIEYYNLDVIISVGYRVKSKRGTQFRIWATQVLKDFILKGYAINEQRLAQAPPDEFDELLTRIRHIRTSERQFFEKVKAVFTTSLDYKSSSDEAHKFFSTIQNKFHYAITQMTAAAIVVSRVDSNKLYMGLQHRKRERVTREEAEVAKNYLDELELKQLELLAEQFMAFAEFRATRRTPMYMRDWLRKLDEFIQFNELPLLIGAGNVSHQEMVSKVKRELAHYNQQLAKIREEAQKLGH